MTTNDLIGWLQQWYVSHCDGDWEHQHGVEITTLDNPGWSMRIDVGDALRTFERVEWEDGDEWLVVWLENGQLNFACGPRSLSRGLALVRETLSG